MRKSDVPRTVFNSDNDWGIPSLNDRLCADFIDLPLVQWGTRSRRNKMNGVWGFYVDDYRFNGLWSNPQTVINTGCISVIEPNFSIFPYTPPAEALYQIYKKRYLARLWQELAGIKIFVDLNVPLEFQELNFLGVPKGWRAYATRGYSDRLELLNEEHALAKKHASGNDLLFIVYGGGIKVKDWCISNNVYWFTEQQDLSSGNKRRTILENLNG